MRLSKDDSSWHARGIIRRDYRHDYGTPEVPRHKGKKKKKTKHVHDYKPYDLGTHVVKRRYWNRDGTGLEVHETTERKTGWVCTGCGHKKGHNYWGWGSY